MADFTQPSIQVLIALGSAVVHADEFFSAQGNEVDKTSFMANLRNEELREWLGEMTKNALVPLRRDDERYGG